MFLNGILMGDIEFLRTYHVHDVDELRFLDPGRAAIQYGMGHPRGIIEIIPARR